VFKIVFIGFFCFQNIVAFAKLSFSINATEKVLNQPVSKLAIEDVKQLIGQACNCPASINAVEASIQINLPEPELTPFNKVTHQKGTDDVPYFYYPHTDFEWSAIEKDVQLHLNLNTPSYEGVAAALYALLQEQLGFRFYHPREMIIPNWETFSLKDGFSWAAKARFVKRGFHLHTMHPIELTEALLDPDFPDGLNLIKEYINWLARNGQNYFEFNLLRTVNLEAWVPYAKQFTDYAHQRGIIMGFEISLHMIQQRAFILYQH